MSVGGRDMFFVDLVSEQPISPDGSKSRILGGIFPINGETWFFKMIGPDQLVESQRDAFKQFLQSVHVAEGIGRVRAGTAMTRTLAATTRMLPTPRRSRRAQGAPLQYTLPPGWQEKPLSPMRLASFKATSPDGKETDVSVVSLPGIAGGDLANVNRWRGQVQPRADRRRHAGEIGRACAGKRARFPGGRSGERRSRSTGSRKSSASWPRSWMKTIAPGLSR